MTTKDQFKTLGSFQISTLESKKLKHDLKQLKRAERHLFRNKNSITEKENKEHEEVILTDHKQYLNLLSSGLIENHQLTPSIISIFVGSPSPDFNHERNILFYRAHTDFKAFCKENSLELNWVDLRWAVNDCEITNKEFTDLSCWCIRSCCQEYGSPSSIQLLGTRYGFQPVPYSIQSKEFQIILNLARKNFKPLARMLLEWYREDTNCLPSAYVLQKLRLPLEEAKPSDLDPTLKEFDGDTPVRKSNVLVPEKRVDLTKIDVPSEWLDVEPLLKDLLVRAVDYSCDLGQMPDSRLRHYKLSALELEVRENIFPEEGFSPNPKCLYSRTIEKIQNDSIEKAEQYFDVIKNQDQSTILHQEKLKLMNDLRKKARVSIKKSNGIDKNFSINFSDIIEEKFPEDYLTTFSDSVLKDLKSQVTLHINNTQEKQEVGFLKEAMQSNHRLYQLSKEIQHHDILRNKFAQDFCGRSGALDWIKHWLLDQSNLSFAFIFGPSASGKSCLVARSELLANKWYAKTSVVKVVRFIGTSCDSSCLESLLVSIIRQLALAYNLDINETRMKMLQSVVLYFQDILHYISTNYGKQRPLFIFLDGLDYLEDDEFSKSMRWLPQSLPYFVKLLVSSSVNFPENNHQSIKYLNMEPMLERTCRELISALLEQEARRINDLQMATALTSILQTGLPLHAKLVVREAENWSSYDRCLIAFDGESIDEIINRYLDHLEQKHGKVLVSYALGYITVSHFGLSFPELEDLLSCNDEVLQEIFQSRDPPPRSVIRIPPLTFMSLRYDLELLLRPSLIHGVSPVYWKNSIVTQIAYTRYAGDEVFPQLHKDMSLFYITAEPIRNDISINTAKGEYFLPNADRFIAHVSPESKHRLPRKLRSIVHHLTHGQQLCKFKELVACNFGTINTWIREFKPRRTISMLHAAMNILKPSSGMNFDVEIKSVHDVLYQCRYLLEEDPSQLAEQLIGRLLNFREHDAGLVGKICPNIRQLCDDCRIHLLQYGSTNQQNTESFYVESVYPCLPSNLGAVKWYHDSVKCVYSICKCQNYLLLLVQNAERVPCLSIFDTRIMQCNWTVPAPEEPVDAQINYSVTLVIALYRKSISVYNLADGSIVCSLSNEVPGVINHPINTCLAVSQNDKAIATALDDKIAIYFNKGSVEDYRTARFEFEKMITVKTSHHFLACTSVDTEKVSLLITAYISKNEGLIMLRAANFDTHESLSSISLPPIRDLYQQIPQPLLSQHMVPIGHTGKIVVLLADGQVFVVDLFAPVILWTYQEPINPNYLKIETPRLKYLLIDNRTNCILFTIKYGPDVFLRIYDISKSEFIFFLKSSEPYEQISSACFKYGVDGVDTSYLIIGGSKGNCVAMDLEFAEKQDASTIFGEDKQKSSFKAHYSAVCSLFYIRGNLLSLDNRKLLKCWLFEEITARYYSKLIVEKKSTLLHNEPIRSMCVTSDNKHVVTSSERLVKVWKIDDGTWVRTLRLKWVTPNNIGEYIEDCSKIALTDSDNYIITESKMKNILFVAKFHEGLALSCVKYPKVWCCSSSQQQSNPIIGIIYSKDNCKFTLKILSIPTLNCQLVKQFHAPHPGIEESIRDLCFQENQNFILLKWAQKASESFEGLSFNISPDHSTNIYDSADKDHEDSEESEDESTSNIDSFNAKSGLVACAQSSQKSSLGVNAANTLFWKITTWLPAANSEKVFVGALSGQIPIWHLNSGDCQPPYLPCMEAWMKHSVTTTFVKLGVKPPARRTYDEFSIKKSAISAIACGYLLFDVSTGMPHVVASGARDGSIIIWHSKKAALERDYDLMKSWSHRTIIREAHSVQITSLHFMKGDEILLSASLDSTICVISTRKGSIINRLFTTTSVQQFYFVQEPEYVLARCANDSEQRIVLFKLLSPRNASN